MILWGVVVALHLVALVSGILVLRRKASTLLGAIAATIGATGFVGLVLYFIATHVVLPIVA